MPLVGLGDILGFSTPKTSEDWLNQGSITRNPKHSSAKLGQNHPLDPDTFRPEMSLGGGCLFFYDSQNKVLNRFAM